MPQTFKILVIALIVAGAMLAQPVANVTSSAPFTLRGAQVTPGQGVPTWPVMAGDTVKAGTAPTLITFPDGSVITLDPGAEAILNYVNGKPLFQLVSGTAHYSLKSLDAVQLVVGGKTVIPQDLTGVLGGGKQGAGTFWTKGHTIAVFAGVGAAAGLGAGVAAATSGGAPLSAR